MLALFGLCCQFWKDGLISYLFLFCLKVYGDMGYTNAVSLNRLVQEVNSGGYDAVIHVGGNI